MDITQVMRVRYRRGINAAFTRLPAHVLAAPDTADYLRLIRQHLLDLVGTPYECVSACVLAYAEFSHASAETSAWRCEAVLRRILATSRVLGGEVHPRAGEFSCPPSGCELVKKTDLDAVRQGRDPAPEVISVTLDSLRRQTLLELTAAPTIQISPPGDFPAAAIRALVDSQSAEIAPPKSGPDLLDATPSAQPGDWPALPGAGAR